MYVIVFKINIQYFTTIDFVKPNYISQNGELDILAYTMYALSIYKMQHMHRVFNEFP